LRIKYLDGLRGVAILLVLFFHAYSRWPDVVPYADTYATFPLFKLGWLGVQLFFLVSGFVIFLTLDKTKAFSEFIYKRWLRLFPAMLVASLIIFATAQFFYERPAGEPNALNLLPGLTFVEPDWWGKILGMEISSLEGAFWSLYVEFKFYIIAGIIYFLCGRQFLVPALATIYIAFLILQAVSTVTDIWIISVAVKISFALSLKYFGWFAAGAMYYLYAQTSKEKWFLSAVTMSVLSCIAIRTDFAVSVVTVAALMVCALFAASIKVEFIQRVLQNKVMLFFGFISYPLYLMHENAMISMIVKTPAVADWLHPFFYPAPAILLLSIVSYVVAKYVEPRCRNWLRMDMAAKLALLSRPSR
jgi:peptidoglycan/LPS O-acetylase OafA/YrhL